MNNRFLTEMDPELREKIRGMSPTQIELMADILSGIGRQLTKSAEEKRADQERNQNSRN